MFASSSSFSQPLSLPTMEQLSQDSFFKQVEYGRIITQKLQDTIDNKDYDDNDDDYGWLEDALTIQLSHANGIRGFMVSYLTTFVDQVGEKENLNHHDEDPYSYSLEELYSSSTTTTRIPVPLRKAIEKQDDNPDLISLACMNVIMPTAMITMHTTKELSRSSFQTAQKAIQLFQGMMELYKKKKCNNNENDNENSNTPTTSSNPSSSCRLLRDHVQAILLVAQQEQQQQPQHEESSLLSKEDNDTFQNENNPPDNTLVEYWTQFFEKWGYQERQRNDIATVMNLLWTKQQYCQE